MGYVALLDVHCAHVPCRFSRLIAKLDKKTGEAGCEGVAVSAAAAAALCVTRQQAHTCAGK